MIRFRRSVDFGEAFGLSGESKPEPSEEWLVQLFEGLADCDGAISGYLAYEWVDGEHREALFVQVAALPPDAEWVERLSASLDRSGARQTALERALARTGGTSAAFAAHFFTSRELDVVRDAGVLVWQRREDR